MGDIVVDSAADESCWPQGPGDAFSTMPSKKKGILKIANGGEMSHYGEKEVTFQSGAQDDVIGLKFQETDVKKPFWAVRRLVEKGSVVMFGPEPCQNYIRNLQTRKKILMEKKRWCVRDQGPLCERNRCGFHPAGVMKERDLQTVRPRWVCGTQEKEVEQVTYDLEKSLSSLEVDAEDPEQQCGQRRLRTMLDPMLQSQSEVEQHCPHTHAVQKLVP